MNHSEALEQMAAERYLLDELAPELREAFEEHVFDCQECALDLRAGSAFVDEARLQLPALTAPAPQLPSARRVQKTPRQWFAWLTPAFAVPAMAVLVAVIAYQNIATIPALRSAANQPEVAPWTSVHVGTRAAAPTPVVADRSHGAVLLVDLPQQGTYASYAFSLYDAQGARLWMSGPISSAQGESGTVSLFIPGNQLRQGAYSLEISGNLPTGQSAELGRRALDVSFGNP
jgi:anti-sigma factor RsiW